MLTNLQALRNRGSEEGFTLIELLVVIIIIGILSAIALPLFFNQQKEGIKAGIKSDVRNTVTNVVTYLVKYPTSMSLGSAGGGGPYHIATGPIKVVATDKSTRVFVTGPTPTKDDWDAYIVYATNKEIGYAYKFDSKTGKYYEGTISPADAVNFSSTPA